MLIDFGLARPWQDDGGQALAERPEAAFRGSTTYASGGWAGSSLSIEASHNSKTGQHGTQP